MHDHVPNEAVYLGIALIIINAVCGVGLLIRELAFPPRRFRALAIALLLAAASVIAFQLTTDYYFAFPNADLAVKLGAIFAYILVMTLVLSGRRMARLHRIVGGLGFAVPVLLLVLSHDFLLGSFIAIFGFGPNTPAFQGRFSPDSSYVISIDHVLYGNAPYYRYRIFRNPRWLPIIRKQTATGALNLCRVPAFAAGVNAAPNQGEWQVWCRPTQNTLVSAEVSATSVAAELPTQIPN